MANRRLEGAGPGGPALESLCLTTDRRYKMSNRLYLIVSGAIFLLVGIFHLFRLVYHWQILVGTRMIPHALSYVGFPVSMGYFVWACWLLFSKNKSNG